MVDPSTHPPPEQRPLPALKGSRELFDINILPERFQRRKLTLMVLLPWLILIVLMGTIYPTYTLGVQVSDSFRETRLDLARAQAALDFYQATSQEQENLQSQIDELLAHKESMLQAYGGIELSTIQWNPTLVRINDLLPDGAIWLQVAQQGNVIRLDGIATEYQQVINLLDSLILVDRLAEVEIETIKQIDPEELPENLVENDLESPLAGPAAAILYNFSIIATVAGEVE